MTYATTQDTRAASFAALGNETRRNLQQRLYDSLAYHHRQGVRDMSARELRDAHAQHTGEHVELSSMASALNGLVAAGRLQRCQGRACSVTGREVAPVACVARQVALRGCASAAYQGTAGGGV